MKLYKPNPSKTGNAVGFRFNSKDGALYAEFVKQSGWDAAAHRGTFNEGAKISIKFNAVEIGAMLNCIERGKASKLFHKAAKGATTIHFEVYPAPKPDAPVKPRDGFTISVLPNGQEQGAAIRYGFWFNENESRALKEYLQFVLEHFFAAEYSADKQQRAAYLKSKSDTSQAGSDPMS